MKIIVQESFINEAKEYALISRKFTSNRHDFHEGGLDAKQRKMFEGKLGEKIVKQFFITNNIKFIEDKSSHEETDEFDFIVFSKKTNSQLKIDVKTRTENFHIRTLEMVEQIQKKPKDIYLSVRLYKEIPYTGEIIGFAIKADFLNIGRIENQGYLDNYVLFDNELRDIEILRKGLIKNG